MNFMNKITDEHNLLESNKSYKVLIEGPKPELRIPSLTISSLKKRRKKILIIFLIIFFALSLTIGSVLRWYFVNLEPVDPNSNEAIILEIKYGETQREIAQSLEDAGVIKNSFIFNLYTQVTNTKNELKAGVYKLFKHDSLQNTVDKLVSGKGTEISIMFIPGANVMNIEKVLIENGFTKEEILAAFNKSYDNTLLKIKPEGNDVEGFIYGDTYSFDSQANIETILERSFAELKSVIDDNKLTEKFNAQGLSLYQGLTLASIVQREVNSPKGIVPSEDQRIVAGIFYNRLRIGMMLGSDVTYQYIADKLGVPRDTRLDNPYNTRRFAGLPPGPISSPGLTALLATSEPKDTDYLFFLSGDDYRMHYSVDDAGHQSNIVQFCSKNCSTL
jgi:UPF0755 protein